MYLCPKGTSTQTNRCTLGRKRRWRGDSSLLTQCAVISLRTGPRGSTHTTEGGYNTSQCSQQSLLYFKGFKQLNVYTFRVICTIANWIRQICIDSERVYTWNFLRLEHSTANTNKTHWLHHRSLDIHRFQQKKHDSPSRIKMYTCIISRNASYWRN